MLHLDIPAVGGIGVMVALLFQDGYLVAVRLNILPNALQDEAPLLARNCFRLYSACT